MIRLFWPYLVFYVALSIWSTREGFVDGDPAIILATDIVAVVLSVTGMLLYRLSSNPRPIARIWRFVFVFLFADFVISTVRAIAESVAEDPEDAILMVVVTALVIIILLPDFIMNGSLAFGRRARPWERRAAGAQAAPTA